MIYFQKLLTQENLHSRRRLHPLRLKYLAQGKLYEGS